MPTNSLVTPDEARRVLESLETRDLIVAACLAHLLVHERGYDTAHTGGTRRFSVYKGREDRLGYLELLPGYAAAWYPIPSVPVQFELPLTEEEPTE